MPVHLFGLAANMDEVMEYAHKKNLKVIEDAAQAIGIKWDNTHCGTFGDAGCFSFFADKTITTGEGGFVVTNNEDIYKKMLYLRNQGRLDRGSFIHPEIGYNFRITDIQAAIGIVQLAKLDEIKNKKINLLNLYKSYLSNLESIRIIEPNSKSNHIPFRVVLMTEEPIQGLMDHFTKKEIEVRSVFYPLHKQSCYTTSNNTFAFPNSTYAYDHAVCLPSYPALEKEKVEYICESISNYYV